MTPTQLNPAATAPIQGVADAHSTTRLTTLSGLPATEYLLLQGGDARIALGADGISNKYGCTPVPDDALLAFGSSTASSISSMGFKAADNLRQKLLLSTKTETPDLTYAREIGRIRDELAALCKLHEVPGTDVVFAASGTDLHLLASQLVSSAESMPVLVIMVDPEETGRGVPLAVAGRHFNAHAAMGKSVEEGAPITGAAAIEVTTVAIRLADGTPKAASDIDAEIVALAHAAVMHKQRVLLILTDVTKTGMLAPSLTCVTTLQLRYPENIDIMVDACQFRIAETTLHAYLRHGFMVAVTGSKFLTGPTFAGALLLPPASAQRLRHRSLPPALADYSSRADWPEGWTAVEVLNKAANFGLLLRWEAALEELRAFRSVSEAQITSFLQEFRSAVQIYLQKSPAFSSLTVPQINRQHLNTAKSWDQHPTIFPFLLYRPDARGRTPLTREQTMEVYQLLRLDLSDRADLDFITDKKTAALRCQLGQPVACGTHDGMPVSALRLCISARHIVEASTQNGKQIPAIIARALSVLEKTAMLAAGMK